MKNVLQKCRSWVSQNKASFIVICLGVLLVFTAYHGYEEECMSIELYGPSYGDDYLVEHVVCKRVWLPGWSTYFFIFGGNYSRTQTANALVVDHGEYILQRDEMNNSTYFVARLHDGRVYENSDRGRVVSINNSGEVVRHLEIESLELSGLSYSPIWYNDARLKKIELNDEQIKNYSLSYPFHVLQIIAPRFKP